MPFWIERLLATFWRGVVTLCRHAVGHIREWLPTLAAAHMTKVDPQQVCWCVCAGQQQRPLRRISNPRVHCLQTGDAPRHNHQLAEKSDEKRTPLSPGASSIHFNPPTEAFHSNAGGWSEQMKNIETAITAESSKQGGIWWPGTESNRRRQPFQGWLLPQSSCSIKTSCFVFSPETA